MAEQFTRKVGYTEMYEWIDIPEQLYGLFVQFSKKEPNKIEPFHDEDGVLLGVSTVAATDISDDPDVWDNAYMFNEYGDFYLKKERLAVGIKQYDQHQEFSFISTQPWEHFINVPNPDYDEKRKYTKRSLRNEWAKVNLIGKVIVKCPDVECKAGTFCTPYIGKKKKLAGSAVPYKEGDKYKFYILERLSDETVLIVNKNMI